MIRAVHGYRLQRGLKMALDGLDECYLRILRILRSRERIAYLRSFKKTTRMHKYFVDFVCQQAKMQNNLSICFLSSSSGPSPMRKSVDRYNNQRSSPLYKSMAERKGALLKELLFPQAVLRSVGGDLAQKFVLLGSTRPASRKRKSGYMWYRCLSFPEVWVVWPPQHQSSRLSLLRQDVFWCRWDIPGWADYPPWV